MALNRSSVSVPILLIYKNGLKELGLLTTSRTPLVPCPYPLVLFFHSFLEIKIKTFRLLLQVRIAMVGKYVGMADSYLSVVKVRKYFCIKSTNRLCKCQNYSTGYSCWFFTFYPRTFISIYI